MNPDKRKIPARWATLQTSALSHTGAHTGAHTCAQDRPSQSFGWKGRGVRTPPVWSQILGGLPAVRQLSHLRGSWCSDTVWLLDKGTEEIQTSTRAVHILLVRWEQGCWSRSLRRPALQALSSRLLHGPGIWGEKGELARCVCSAVHSFPRGPGLCRVHGVN